MFKARFAALPVFERVNKFHKNGSKFVVEGRNLGSEMCPCGLEEDDAHLLVKCPLWQHRRDVRDSTITLHIRKAAACTNSTLSAADVLHSDPLAAALGYLTNTAAESLRNAGVKADRVSKLLTATHLTAIECA